jgi:hypothetical protein
MADFGLLVPETAALKQVGARSPDRAQSARFSMEIMKFSSPGIPFFSNIVPSPE